MGRCALVALLCALSACCHGKLSRDGRKDDPAVREVPAPAPADDVEAPPPPHPAPEAPPAPDTVAVPFAWVDAFSSWTDRFGGWVGRYERRERARAAWEHDFHEWADRFDTWSVSFSEHLARDQAARRDLERLKKQLELKARSLRDTERQRAELLKELEAWRRWGRRRQ